MGALVLALGLSAIFVLNIPILFHHKLPYVFFFKHCFFVLLLGTLLCLYRVMKGPTAAPWFSARLMTLKRGLFKERASNSSGQLSPTTITSKVTQV